MQSTAHRVRRLRQLSSTHAQGRLDYYKEWFGVAEWRLPGRHFGPVGPAVARELYGTLKHFRAPAAILASTSGFTKGVVAFARNKPIRLMGLTEIIALQEGHSASNSPFNTDARGQAARAG